MPPTKNKKILIIIILLLIMLTIKWWFPFLLLASLFFFFLMKLKKWEPRDVGNFFKKMYTNFNSNTFNSTKSTMETIDPRKKGKLIWGLVAAVLLVVFFSFISSFFVVVQAGETGVASLFGRVRDQELSSGFHLKNPLVKVTKMNVRTKDYTMSVLPNEGNKTGDDSISALTKEGLSVDLDITVLYHLIENKASDIYKNIGMKYDEVLIRPEIRSAIREVIAEYEAKDIYSEKRKEATQKIVDRLKSKLDERGILIEEVLLRHVELPADLAKSIQAKLTAEQENERYNFLLEKEKKEAERKRLEAEGQRDA